MRDNTVLLVDDDLDDIEILLDVFKVAAPSTECIICRDSTQVLTMLGEMTKLPVAIFLDVNMPKLSGYEVLELIRNNSRYDKIIVIMLSTTIQAVDKAHLKNLGAQYAIEKPVSFDGYMTLISHFFKIIHKDVP